MYESGKMTKLDKNSDLFQCRPGCAACCIAPSISSSIPEMEHGKPSGVRCSQLTADNLCRVFGMGTRPSVCLNLKPSREMCGSSQTEAMEYLEHLELVTTPGN